MDTLTSRLRKGAGAIGALYENYWKPIPRSGMLKGGRMSESDLTATLRQANAHANHRQKAAASPRRY